MSHDDCQYYHFWHLWKYDRTDSFNHFRNVLTNESSVMWAVSQRRATHASKQCKDFYRISIFQIRNHVLNRRYNDNYFLGFKRTACREKMSLHLYIYRTITCMMFWIIHHPSQSQVLLLIQLKTNGCHCYCPK